MPPGPLDFREATADVEPDMQRTARDGRETLPTLPDLADAGVEASGSPHRCPGPSHAAALGLVCVLYVAALILATTPRILNFETDLPTLSDPVTHLWTMRWYRHCLVTWRSPMVHDGLHAPLGFPLGLNPPMQLPLVFYGLLSLVLSNDILIYNILWFASFLFAGMATFLLAARLTGDRPAAFVAGLLVMLGTPMMNHGFEHLELIQVGWFPLFLLAWIRFVDEAGFRRLAGAAAGYLLLTMSAPYFGVLAIFPAALYVIWRPASLVRPEGWRAAGDWCRRRTGWLVAFAAVILPLLPLLFATQVWTALHGFSVTRPRAEFESYGATLWSYVVPTRLHRLGQLLPFDVYDEAGFEWRQREKSSYLGIVTVGLLAIGLLRRPSLFRAGYWWTALGLMILLSMGAGTTVGTHVVPLPSGWLFDHFEPFQLLRVPGRFNLFVTVTAAVIAAAVLADLRRRARTPGLRFALTAGLAVLAIADLSMYPYGSTPVPDLPDAYRFLKGRDTGSGILDIPHVYTAHNQEVSPMAAYWQSFHGGRTTAGYGAHGHRAHDNLYAFSSPFSSFDMAGSGYVSDPAHFRSGPFREFDFRDYVWLYLTVHDFPYVVLHEWSQNPPMTEAIGRLKTILKTAIVHQDGRTTVLERARLKRPEGLVWLGTTGWGPMFPSLGTVVRSIDRRAQMVVYDPEAGRPVRLGIEAAALGPRREIRVVGPGSVLGRWTVGPGSLQTWRSEPFVLPPGVQILDLQCNGEAESPDAPGPSGNEPARYSARVNRIWLERAE